MNNEIERKSISLNTNCEASASQYKPKCSSTAIGVYLIKCKECSKVCIGETGRSFKLRIGEQNNNCKHYVNGKSAIADHIATHKHAINLTQVVIPKTTAQNVKLLKHYILRVNKCSNRISHQFHYSFFNMDLKIYILNLHICSEQQNQLFLK